MSRRRLFLFCAVFALCVQPSPAGPPDLGPEPFAYLAQNPQHWPLRVTLRFDVWIKLHDDGREVGAVMLERGSRVWLLRVYADSSLLIRRGSIRGRVDHAATTFLDELRD